MSTKFKNIKITSHAKSRTKTRLGLTKRRAKQNADKAWRLGLKHNECKGDLTKYINSLFFKSNRHANNIRVYKRNVYIFAHNNLITVFPLPENLYEISDKLEKNKEINREYYKTWRMINT